MYSTKAVIISLLVCTLCLPLPSLHDSDFYEIFLLLVLQLDIYMSSALPLVSHISVYCGIHTHMISSPPRDHTQRPQSNNGCPLGLTENQFIHTNPSEHWTGINLEDNIKVQLWLLVNTNSQHWIQKLPMHVSEIQTNIIRDNQLHGKKRRVSRLDAVNVHMIMWIAWWYRGLDLSPMWATLHTRHYNIVRGLVISWKMEWK